MHPPAWPDKLKCGGRHSETSKVARRPILSNGAKVTCTPSWCASLASMRHHNGASHSHLAANPAQTMHMLVRADRGIATNSMQNLCVMALRTRTLQLLAKAVLSSKQPLSTHNCCRAARRPQVRVVLCLGARGNKLPTHYPWAAFAPDFAAVKPRLETEGAHLVCNWRAEICSHHMRPLYCCLACDYTTCKVSLIKASYAPPQRPAISHTSVPGHACSATYQLRGT